MRKLLSYVSLLMLAPVIGVAQSSNTQEETVPYPESAIEGVRQQQIIRKSSSSANVLWSEDFSNGIPSTWSNSGFDRDAATGSLTPNPLCLWEYRGPSTTPSNSTGSRGQFAGSGPTIQSPTASNGFIIFDSDYLDSDGISGNRGGGDSPAPHVGTLSTDTIDLTGYPGVLVSLYSRARNFHSRRKLAVSGDGGVTFPDTVEFHPNLPVNSTSSSGEEVVANISAVAGNSSLVVIQLIYEGWDASSDDGYYYWQIDDMEIREIPKHSMQFVEYNGAPPTDLIYPPRHPEYGNPQIDQVLPITFDSNIFNFGLQDQTNVYLEVTVKDGTGAVAATLYSDTVALLSSGDTANYTQLTTTSSWTPSAIDQYTVIWTTKSDSIPVNGVPMQDSVVISANEFRHGCHFNIFSNSIGTNQDRIALAQAFTYPNSHPDAPGSILIDGVNIRFSSDSDTNGVVIVEVYDTAGFAYGSGAGPAGNPIKVKSFSLSSSTVGTWAYVDLTNSGTPLSLPAPGGYFIVVNLIPSTGNIIQIGNDQTISIPTSSANPLIGMQRSDGTWFSGYTSSLTLSNLLIEMVVSPKIGLDEVVTENNLINIYPQPAPSEELNIQINHGGTYTLEMYTYGGQKVHAETISVNNKEVIQRNFSNLSKGIYLLKLYNNSYSTTKKLILE